MKTLSLRYLFNRRYIKQVLINTFAVYFLCYCRMLAKLGEGKFPIFLLFALIIASFNKYFYGEVSYYFNQKYVDKKTLPLGLLYLGKVLKWIGYCIWIYYFIVFILCANPSLISNNKFLMMLDSNKFLIMIRLLIASLLVLGFMYFYKKYKMFSMTTYGVLILLNFFVVLFSITINNYIDIKNENPNIELQVIGDIGNKI